MLRVDPVLYLLSEVTDVVKSPHRQRLSVKTLLAPQTGPQTGPVSLQLGLTGLLLLTEIFLQAEVEFPVSHGLVPRQATPGQLSLAAVSTSEGRTERQVGLEQLVEVAEVVISPASLVSVEVAATDLTDEVLVNLQLATPLEVFLGFHKFPVKIFLQSSVEENFVFQQVSLTSQLELTVRALPVRAGQDLVLEMKAEVQLFTLS